MNGQRLRLHEPVGGYIAPHSAFFLSSLARSLSMTNDSRPATGTEAASGEHDPEAAKDAERKLRGGGTGIGDPDTSRPDGLHDPAAVADAERKMRGGRPDT
jgi:hypothetical protein